MQRLESLFNSDNESDDRLLDNRAASENVNLFLQKIDKHLNLEKALIDEWEDYE